MTNRTKNIRVRITDKEEEMIKTLAVIFGDISVSDTIRRCIQERYQRAFPAYKKKNNGISKEEEETLTVEQLCEKSGGKISKHEGTPVCVFQHPSGGMTGRVPLSNPELFDGMAKRFGILK
jgi:hypothetical protein